MDASLLTVALVFFRKLLETLTTLRWGRRSKCPFIQARAVLAELPAQPSERSIETARAAVAWKQASVTGAGGLC